MRKTLMMCAVAGLLAAPVTVATMASARADDVPRGELRQDRQDIRRDESSCGATSRSWPATAPTAAANGVGSVQPIGVLEGRSSDRPFRFCARI